jgi:hypothetical protein
MSKKYQGPPRKAKQFLVEANWKPFMGMRSEVIIRNCMHDQYV